MRFSFHLLIPMLFSLLAACASEPEKAKFSKQNFSTTVAMVRVIKGKVVAGKSLDMVHGLMLLKEGDPLSTGQGEAEVSHENGVRFILSEASKMAVQEHGLSLESGEAWVEFPRGISADCFVNGYKLRSRGAALEVHASGKEPGIYVFNGELLVEKDGSRYVVKEGNQFLMGSKPSVAPITWWDSKHLPREWKRGSSLELVPGQGVLGARRPGQKGKAHLPLVISSMDVKVNVVGDMAITEVKQRFLNPSSDTLEGIYRFRAPEGAIVTGFAVDRSGKLVFGRIKGKELAKQQYSSNVYQGSTEDPALLEWEDQNQYKALIYPIKPGAKRTIFIRFTSWLPRKGPKRNLRYYHLPLVGHDDRSPKFGEFNLVVKLGGSWAGKAMANLKVKPDGDKLIVRESDFRTTTDFHMILEDGGISGLETSGWYGRPLGRNPPKVRRDDFVLSRVWPFTVEEGRARAIDLVVLVDLSADSSSSGLNLARLAVENAVKSLKTGDRLAIVTGDLSLRKSRKYIEIGKGDPVKMLESLAMERRGGATDITELLKQTATEFSTTDPGRAPVLLYVGNGRPTVGEVSPDSIAKKWFQLPHFIGFRAIATEDGDGFEVLKRLSGGHDPLLLTTPGVIRQIPGFLNSFRSPRLKRAQVKMSGSVGKVFPHPQQEFEYEGGEPIVVVGQLSEGSLPESITITGELDGKEWKRTFKVAWGRFTDTRELARRYGAEKLTALMEEGASSEVLMDLGLRYNIVTPFTSLYVPTEREARDQGLLLEDEEGDGDDHMADKTVTTKEESKKDTSANKDRAPSPGSKQKTAALSTSTASEAPAVASTPAPAKSGEKSVYKKMRRKRSSRRSPRNHGKGGSYSRGLGATSSSGSARPVARPPKASPKKPARRLRGPSRDKRYHTLDKIKLADGLSSGIGGGGGGSGGIGIGGGYVSSNINGVRTGYRGNNTFIANTMIFCMDCKWQRKPSPCSAVSKLPLWQRRGMWRERLAGIYPYKALEAYNDAIRLCEIPGPSSKRVFLRLVVSMLGKVRNLVSFYKIFTPKYGYYTFLKSAIISRITSVSDLLYVKRALGLGTGFQRAKIEELLEKATSVKERIAIVRKFVEKGDGDPWLKIKLIHLYEESGNRFLAGRIITPLFGNPMLDEELRLSAVEYLIRTGQRPEARRLLSEVVEFSPNNPLRRKILGSLYRAFGWSKFAVREFTSLMTLTSGAHESMLMLALAWEDAGAHEKALALYAKVMTQGDPGSGLVKLARILASAHLARLRLAAKPAARATMLQKGRNMALFRNDEAVKILLTYKHPKSDLELQWGESEADLRRVSFLKPRWGVEGVVLQKVPSSLTFKVVRGSPRSKRDLTAEFLVILNEGTKAEKIVKKALIFKDGVKQMVITLKDGVVTVGKGEK